MTRFRLFGRVLWDFLRTGDEERFIGGLCAVFGHVWRYDADACRECVSTGTAIYTGHVPYAHEPRLRRFVRL